MVSQRQETQLGSGNLLDFLNLINDSTKYVVTLAAGGVLVWYHDIYVSWCLLGSVVAVYVCKVSRLSSADHITAFSWQDWFADTYHWKSRNIMCAGLEESHKHAKACLC